MSSQGDDRPPLEATLRLHKQELELGLYGRLARRGQLSWFQRERAGATAFLRRRFDAAPTRRIPTPNGSELQFFRAPCSTATTTCLFELGSEDEPQRLLNVTTARPNAPASARESDAESHGLLRHVRSAGSFGRRRRRRRDRDCTCDARTPLASGTDPIARARAYRAPSNAPASTSAGCATSAAIGLTAAGGALLVGSIVSLC